MEKRARTTDEAALILLNQHEADGYINASAAASARRERAEEMAATIVIRWRWRLKAFPPNDCGQRLLWHSRPDPFFSPRR